MSADDGAASEVVVDAGDVSGAVPEVALDQAVERGLKRARMESAGDDSGGQEGFKVYKPDTVNPSDEFDSNDQKYNFGPHYQMRDVTTATNGGIVVSKSSDDTLEFSIGGPAVVLPAGENNAEILSDWATVPAQVYTLQQSFNEFTGSTPAAVLAAEDLQNTRLTDLERDARALERETGIVPSEPEAPSEEEQFPVVYLHQRLAYLDKLLRGTEDNDSLFHDNNIEVSVLPFSCPQTSLPRDPNQADAPTTPLFDSNDLMTKGALGIVWDVLAQVQQTRDALTRFTPQTIKRRIAMTTAGHTFLTRDMVSGDDTLISDADHRGYVRFELNRTSPGKEIMYVRWDNVTHEFEFDRTKQLLPDGFKLSYQEQEGGPLIDYPTFFDPSENKVTDPYMPIDILRYRRGEYNTEGRRSFIRTDGSDPALDIYQGGLPIEYDDFSQSAGDAQQTETIDLRAQLQSTDAALARLGSEFGPAYGAIQSLNKRLARLEAWRENFAN
jgi:hypothetical protein